MDKKVQNRLDDMFEKGEIDAGIFEENIHTDIQKKLLDYQLLHVLNIVSAINKYSIAIDGSWTGTGKTYTSIAACKHLNLRPYIICPKSIIGTWKRVCEYYDVDPITIVNYETLRSGKEYDSKLKKIDSKNLTLVKDEYVWKFINRNTLVIFDEVHKCKHIKSINGQIFLAAKNKAKILMLSATLCDKPEDFLPFGYMLGLYKNLKSGKSWIESSIRESEQMMGGKSNALNKHIYPKFGSQMTMDDMGEKFPKNQISAECYYIDTKSVNKINKYYKKISEENKSGCNLGIKIKLRMKIEKRKADVIFEIAQKYIEQNKSVVIFVNFLDTLLLLGEMFSEIGHKYNTLTGDQTLEQREISIDDFQKNKVKIMISMIQVGGASIGLHDVTGKSPRVSIISPSFSSIELIQTLGRIYRSGIKTPVLQRIIFCSGTYEEDICNSVRNKSKFISKITDQDLGL
jgi:superfamily II DNA or RNA helicase